MHSNIKQKTKRFTWIDFFMPEDTASGYSHPLQRYLYNRAAGYLKLGIWITISIMSAVAIGQL